MTASSLYQKNLRPAFTLVEVMVSLGMILLISLLLVSIVDTTKRTWIYTQAKTEQFREAREAFETIYRQLSQATLNPYLDCVNSSGQTKGASASFTPDHYTRLSELRFISGPKLAGDLGSTPSRPTHAVFFQAPLGLTSGSTYASLENLLNTVGCFVEFGSDRALRPPCIDQAKGDVLQYRFRLKELIEPAESLCIYQNTSGKANTYSGKEWFSTPLSNTGGGNVPWSRVLADNVIALILLPKLAAGDVNNATQLSGSYCYDSTSTNANATLNPKNQLPPVVNVTMVAIDENSASRLSNRYGSTIPELGLNGLFVDASNLSSDLKQLERKLTELGVNYRIFTADVPIRAAKWSQEQIN